MDLLPEMPSIPQIAKKRFRIFASLIDFTIFVFVCYIIAKVSGQTYTQAGTSGFNLTGIPALIALLLGLLLIPVNEGLTGQTIGMRFFKIQVVQSDFSETTVGKSIVRHLFDGVDSFLLIGLIVASTNPNKQRIGDLVAKTYVVEKE